MRNIYLEKFQILLRRFRLDAILIYANEFDDRFMKALVGLPAILQSYLLINRSGAIISVSHYLVDEFKRRTQLTLLPAPGEHSIIEPLKKLVGKKKKLGVVGNCTFRDIQSLSPNSVVDITKEAEVIIAFKTDEFINELKKKARLLSRLLNSTKISADMTQEEIAADFHAKVAKQGCDLSFPVCVTSGDDLRISTCFSPKNKLIRNSDAICIDVGLKQDIFTTDMTRMFFLRRPATKTIYEQMRFAHREIIDKFIGPELKWTSLIGEYQKRFDEIPGVERCLKEDFGHGVGFGLHEQPMIDQSREKIGKNIVFTIEPTVVTKFGMMRYEDMIAIDSRGQVKILTE